MDGRAFLTVARRLAQEATEADWRSAAGRAYYAVLLEGKAALQRWGFTPPPREQLHRFVRLSLLYAGDQTLKDIGYKLDILAQLRNQADYQPERPGRFTTPGPVRQAVRDAEQAIALLDDIEADAGRRAAAVATIRPPP